MSQTTTVNLSITGDASTPEINYIGTYVESLTSTAFRNVKVTANLATEDQIATVDSATVAISFTNKDATNFIYLRLDTSAGDSIFFKVDALKSILIPTVNFEVKPTGDVWAAWETIDAVSVQADTADCLCELILIGEA